MGLLIWNGSEFFQELTTARNGLGPDLKIVLIALTLNVALILFGWRRYVDLQHEAEMRQQGEERAALIASTDGMTGLLNRKGFADRGEELRCKAVEQGLELIIFSLQLHRFKAINDRHGYDVGDRMLRMIATSLEQLAGPDDLVARLAGDEFAIALAAPDGDFPEVEQLADRMLRSVTRPMEAEGRMVTTIEALSPDGSHPVQQALVAEQAIQCGFCTPGIAIAAAALLARNADPSEADIKAAVTNLCRCGVYPRLVRAIQRAGRIARGLETITP